jgi:hypothetical protein
MARSTQLAAKYIGYRALFHLVGFRLRPVVGRHGGEPHHGQSPSESTCQIWSISLRSSSRQCNHGPLETEEKFWTLLTSSSRRDRLSVARDRARRASSARGQHATQAYDGAGARQSRRERPKVPQHAGSHRNCCSTRMATSATEHSECEDAALQLE